MPRRLFRLGFLNDRHGNDHEAIGFYERCLKYPPIGKGVLYNLGVLYEDNNIYDKATDCFRRLAKADPRDERAKLFVKDAEASLTEQYSPDDEAQNVAFRQVMEIPITDFELSVRSRNCLKLHEHPHRSATSPASPSRSCSRARTSAKRRSKK